MNVLDEFGKEIVENGRDAAIFWLRAVLGGHAKGESSREIHELLKSLHVDEGVIARVLAYAVDTTLFHILYAIQESPGFTLVDKNGGHDIVEASDGFAGEMLTEYGWVARFSKFPTSDVTQ